MQSLERFNQYYDAFEEAYDSDQWDEVATFFTEDAIYEAPRGGKAEGRDVVMATFKNSLDQLDRRFPKKRRIEIIEDQREVTEEYLKLPGHIYYEIPGAPTLCVYMIEHVWFRGDDICKIVDEIPAEEISKMMAHLESYGHLLG